MADGRFISYLRVSTDKQGANGLGIEAQRKAVADYLNGGRWTVTQEVVEVESGKRTDRPKLAEAMALCRLHNAVLVIAKLDRLSRDLHFLTGLQKAGVRFVAADMPEANELVVHIMAAVAQAERKAISTRTKDALAAKARWYANLDEAGKAELTAKGKPTKLGAIRHDHLAGAVADKGRTRGNETKKARASSRASDLSSVIADIRANGASTLREIAAALNDKGIPAAKGGLWSAVQVQRILSALSSDDIQ